MDPLNEYESSPKWIKTLTKEQQYQWYLKIKETLPRLQKLGPTDDLENAIIEYEKKNGIR